VIGQKDIAGGQIAVQNLQGDGKFLLNFCTKKPIVSTTFLLAKNSMPRAIWYDQEINSAVLIDSFRVASESFP
jgi:hypothetical protein